MENQPELFAQQYAEAGLVENSVAYWEKAALRSTDRSAMAEAGAQLQKGLEQLELLPDTPERRRWELKYWSALGAVLLSLKGQAAPETGHAFAPAKELWEQLGSPAEFLQVPYGKSRYHAEQQRVSNVAKWSMDSFTQTYDLTNTSLYHTDNMDLSLSLADIEGTTRGQHDPAHRPACRDPRIGRPSQRRCSGRHLRRAGDVRV